MNKPDDVIGVTSYPVQYCVIEEPGPFPSENQWIIPLPALPSRPRAVYPTHTVRFEGSTSEYSAIELLQSSVPIAYHMPVHLLLAV